MLPAYIAESNVYSANVLFLDITSVSDEPPKVAPVWSVFLCPFVPIPPIITTDFVPEGTDTLFDDVVEVVLPVAHVVLPSIASCVCLRPVKISERYLSTCWDRRV